MIVPLNRDAPAPVAIMMLWGIAASALTKAMEKGTSARPVSELGENWKSRASILRTTGAVVGCGVGVGVGLGVGLAVFVGSAVLVGAGVGRRVGAGVLVGLGATVGVARDAVGVAGDAVALGSIVIDGSAVVATDGATLIAASDADADAMADDPGASVTDGLDTAAPQAPSSRPRASSSSRAAWGHRGLETGIAAL
jgi:hypothetical protein